jgi:hypothetical protein
MAASVLAARGMSGLTIGVLFAVSLLLPFKGVGVMASDASEAAPQPKIKLATIPLSDHELVQRSDRAFIGTVEGVESALQHLGNSKTKSLILLVTFKIEKILFDETGELNTSRPFVVRMYAHGSNAVYKGEHVLWFLAPNSSLGLTQPAGIDSGNFRFVRDEKTVINLKHNRGLLDVERLESSLDRFASNMPESKRKTFLTHAKQWTRTARESKAEGPVPVDLLVARVEELATEMKKK